MGFNFGINFLITLKMKKSKVREIFISKREKEKCTRFCVQAVGFNAEVFKANYRPYITAVVGCWYGDRVFSLFAPVSVKNEIAGLTEEMIEII